jgi:CHASE3 domain sensor protein
MVNYYTTGEPAYKAAAERSMVAFQKHVQALDAKAKEDSEKVAEFIESYDPENQGMDALRDELQQIRDQGPMTGDKYETQKRINEAMPEPEKTNYVLKAGLIVGVLAIGFVAKSFGGD